MGSPGPVEARGEDRAAAITIGTHGLIASQRPKARVVAAKRGGRNTSGMRRSFSNRYAAKAGLTPNAWKSDSCELMIFEGSMPFVGACNPMRRRPRKFAQPPWPECSIRPIPQQIQLELEQLFPQLPQPQPWSAAMVPHAGWMYSGRLAAATLSRVEISETVVVLCPKHRPGGALWSVAPHDVWELPLGNVRSDRQLATRLAGAIEGLEADQAPHAEEHAVEVTAAAAGTPGAGCSRGGHKRRRRGTSTICSASVTKWPECSATYPSDRCWLYRAT